MKQQTFDTANGVGAVAFLTSYLAGFNWPGIAAFLAAVYSLVLIYEKLEARWERWKERRQRG